MTNTKHEDAVIKMGFNYFRDTILKALGINFQYEEIGPTELIELTIHSLYMDFMYILNFKQQIKKRLISADSMHMMRFIPTRPVRKLLHMSFIPVGLLT